MSFVVISDKRYTVHTRAFQYIIQINTIDKENLAQCDILGTFDTMIDANQFMEDVQSKNQIEYTRIILSGEVPVNPNHLTSRFLVVHIDELTPEPGFYSASYFDYTILVAAYPSYIRMPSSEELDYLSTNLNQIKNNIRIKDEYLQAIKTLNLASMDYFDENATDTDIDAKEQLTQGFMKFFVMYVGLCLNCDEDARIAGIMKQTGCGPEEAAMIDLEFGTKFGPMIKQIDQMKKDGAGAEDVAKYASEYFATMNQEIDV